MNQKVLEIVRQISPYKPEKIILFGSYAYGKPGIDSDVDLVLIKRTKEPFLERQKKVRMLLETTTPVDVFVSTPEEFAHEAKANPFFAEVAKYGKTIYE